MLVTFVRFTNATTVTLTTSSGSTWTVPLGVTSINVTTYGGGGGGGPNGGLGGGGGGGGGASVNVISTSPGTVYNYSVGAGGSAGANGQSSWFGGPSSGATPLVMAQYGSTGSIVNGGAGGSAAAGIGKTTYSGGSGGSQGAENGCGAGGGGAAGPLGNGNSGGSTINDQASPAHKIPKAPMLVFSGLSCDGTNGGFGGSGITGQTGDTGQGGFGQPTASAAGFLPGGGGGGGDTNPDPAGAGSNGLIVITYNVPGIPTISVSNSVVDAGQYLNITAYESNGITPYTYNFVISNSITDVTLAFNSVSGITSNTESWLYQIPNSYAQNTIQVNVVVADSGGSANSIYTPPISVNQQFISSGWTASSVQISQGQLETLTSTVAGGTNSLTYAEFNGASSYITVSSGPSLNLTGSFTILVSFYQNQSQGGGYRLVDREDVGGTDGYNFDTYGASSGNALRLCIQTCFSSSTQYNLDQWYQGAVTYNGAAVSFYLDGAPDGNTATNANAPAGNLNLHIGAGLDGGATAFFSGQMGNIQMYNISLSAAQVNSIYAEGISGPPLGTKNLVAWWNLNGNTGDYSSSQNNGVPTNIVYYRSSNAFTYNDVVYASNGMLMENSLVVSTSAASNSFAFSTAGLPIGTYTANSIVTDSATTYETVSNSITFSVIAPTTTSTTTISQHCTICGSGGTGAFTTTQKTTVAPASSEPTTVSSSSSQSTSLVTTAATTPNSTSTSTSTITTANSAGSAQTNIFQQIWYWILNFFSHL